MFDIKLTASTILVVLLFLVTLILHKVLIGGAATPSLKTAAPLTGIISQALDANGSGGIPSPGKDYTLTGVRYFENGAWVVAFVKPVNNSFDPGAVAIEKIDGVYRVVAGPSNDLPSDYLYTMPSDVGSYLKNNLKVVGNAATAQ
jgi:hypothetical protein